MARTLHVTDLGRVEGAEWPGLVAGLQAEGRARLAVARLGGAALTLGRYERAETVLTPHGREIGWKRRITGGRAWALGEGMIGVALALPHRAWLLGDDLREVPAAKILNRCVRGILDGLNRLGVAATYFGRDFVTVDAAQVGALSFDVDAAGHTVVECVLAVEAHWSLPASCDALPPRPPRRGVPPFGMAGKLSGFDSTTILRSVADGYVARFGVEVAEDAAPVTPGTLPADRPALAVGSAVHEIPIGTTEVRLALDGGRISDVAFCGEFLADSGGIAALEAGLVGAAPTLEALAPRMNAVFADAAHTVLGVDDLATWADAIVEAAEAR